MAEGDKYWHFPSHDIPGSARPARNEGVGSGAGGWAWEERPGARAVAGSKLSVLYCKDNTKQQPFYASTKCLLAERDAASEGIALFNDIPLTGSRRQLQPPDHVSRFPDFKTAFVFLFTSVQVPSSALDLRPRILLETLVVLLIALLLPALREALTLNDLDLKDFEFFFDFRCNNLLYIFNYTSCSVWPAYLHLAIFFLLAAPLVLLNRHYHTIFPHLPAVVAGTHAFRKTVLGVSLSQFPPVMRCKPQITMAVHPHAALLSTASFSDGTLSIHFYKMEVMVQRQQQPSRPLHQLELDDGFWRDLDQSTGHVTAM